MEPQQDGRGVLYPARLPTFHRLLVPEELSQRVRWVWIPRWDLPPGRVVRQELLPFPASNLVAEPSGISLVGPAAGAAHRDLGGHGWAVGLLLRPAGLASLCPDPRAIVGREVPVDDPVLHRAVCTAMEDDDEAAGRRRAADALTGWFAARRAPTDPGALLANDLEDLVAADREVVRVGQVAERLGLTVRGVQRLAQRYIGLSPLVVIRRYRLQEAAQRLREDRSLTVAEVAAELGYADHAHLSTDFRQVLGRTPSAYRRGLGGAC